MGMPIMRSSTSTRSPRKTYIDTLAVLFSSATISAPPRTLWGTERSPSIGLVVVLRAVARRSAAAFENSLNEVCESDKPRQLVNAQLWKCVRVHCHLREHPVDSVHHVAWHDTRHSRPSLPRDDERGICHESATGANVAATQTRAFHLNNCRSLELAITGVELLRAEPEEFIRLDPGS